MEVLSWPVMLALLIAIPDAIMFVASVLQHSRIGGRVPDELQGIYDHDEYETSNKYTKAKSTLSLLSSAWHFVIFFAFWFSKGFAILDTFASSFGLGEILTGLVYYAVFGVAMFILDLPWDIYTTFVIEERFGFNKTTPCTFVKDMLKSAVLTVVIGGPLLYVVMLFFLKSGDWGWLYVFVTITSVQLILFFLMPVLILPLFNEMLPLPSGTALIIAEDTKADSKDFVHGRIFYSYEATATGDAGSQPTTGPAWITKDRRFPQATHGEVLSIYFAANGRWVMAEGEPSADGKVYATCDKQPQSGADWVLTEEAKALIHPSATGTEGSPTVGSELLAKDTLSMQCVDCTSLKERLLGLANKLGYHGANIFVIDGSTRSAHSNAFCTGFGRFRRICLFDTLLSLADEDEIVAILGHEIGHDRLYHIHKMLAVTICYLFMMLYVMGLFIKSKEISNAFFVEEPKVYLGLLFFSVIWSIVDFVFSIPLTVSSRKHEFEADRYSVDADPIHAAKLASGLTKMMKRSKANLTPHPFYVFLTYSHPPLDVRLQALKAYHGQRYMA